MLRINGYFAPHRLDIALEFVADRHERSAEFRDYYAKASPRPASQRLNPLPGKLTAPIHLAERADSGRPLLVLFGQGICAECDELHRDILARSEVALTNVDIVQLDLLN